MAWATRMVFRDDEDEDCLAEMPVRNNEGESNGRLRGWSLRFYSIIGGAELQ